MASVLSSTRQSPRSLRGVLALASAFLGTVLALIVVAGSVAASAAEHPPVDLESLDMVPERGWGVAGQNPAETQTPSLEVLVWDMIQSGDRMFVAGAFLNVQNGEDGPVHPQPYLAAFDVDSGEWVETFRPQFDRAIYAVDLLPNGSVLVGGEFENVNGTARAGLVAIDPLTGDIDPSFGGSVSRPFSTNRAMVRDLEVEASGQVYVAGNFAFLIGPDGDRSRADNAGRFTGPAGIPDPAWRPVIGGSSVWGIDTEPDLGEVALSGYFTVVNGEVNSGYFHVVDDATGATVPGKIDIEPNDWGRDPEVFDVVYGHGVLFHIGEQHMVRVLDPSDHRLLGYHHTGIANDGFYEIGRFAGGAYQAGELIGNVLIAGCHCTSGLDNHYTSFTGRRTTLKNVMAYDATTGEHIESFDADVDAVFDGHWAAASDSNGCLWLGGDYHLGGAAAGTPHWLGGFARLCPELPPLQINPVGAGGDGVVNVVAGQAASFDLSVRDTQNASLIWTASGLPAGLSLDAVTGVVSGVVTDPGSSTATITVESADGSTTSGSLQVTVVALDDVGPQVVAVNDRQVNRYSPVELFLTAVDSEGSNLTWSVTGLPTGLTLDEATGRIWGVVTEAGVHEVEVTATDPAGLDGSAIFMLTVEDRATVDLVAPIDVAAPVLVDPASVEAGSVGYAFTVDRPMMVAELGVFVGAETGPEPITAVLYDDTRREMARVQVPMPVDPVEPADPADPVEPADPVDPSRFAWLALERAQELVPGVEYVLVAETGTSQLLDVASVSFLDGVTVTKSVAGTGPTVAWPTAEMPIELGVVGPTLRILEDDATPRVASIPDQVSAVDQPYQVVPIETTGSDPLVWSAVGLPDGVVIDPATGGIDGTTVAAGDFRVVVTATTPSGLFSSVAFTWVVLDNDLPAVVGLPDWNVTQYERFETVASLDPARPGSRWSTEGLPAGLSIDRDSGRIGGNALDDGVFEVTVIATDPDGLVGTTTFTLRVALRPTANVLTANVDPQLKQDETFVGFVFNVDREMELAEVGVNDADGNGVISNTTETTVAVFDNTTQVELARAVVADGVEIEDGFGWVPLPERLVLTPGVDYVVAVTLSGEPWTEWGDAVFIDGFNPIASAFRGGTSVEFPDRQSTFNGRNIGPGLRIIDSGEPPVLDDLDDQVVFVDTDLAVQLSATSPAGRPLTWSAVGLPRGVTLDPATGLLGGVPDVLGVEDVVVTVTDDAGMTDSSRFAMTVRPVPVNPVLDPVADVAVAQYDEVVVQVVADDPNVSWSADGLPTGVQIDASTGLLSGAPLEAVTSTVTVTATNADLLSSSVSFSINVEARSTVNVVQSNTDYQTKLGNNFMGYVFEVDRPMTLTELGVHDTNRDGLITNDGDTTIVLYDNVSAVELLRAEVPAAVVVDADHYGWQALDQPFELQPGVAYALASETSGEPWSEWGRVSFIDGVNPLSAAFKGGSEPGWPSRQRPFNGRHFGPSMRVVDDSPPGEEPPLSQVLLASDAEWRFDDTGVDPGADWMTAAFDDSAWAIGSGEFGFGDGDESTLWAPGSRSYYARTTFNVDGELPGYLRLNLGADDGAVVYLNGTEAFRVNVGDGPISHDTQAASAVYGTGEDMQVYEIPATALVPGANLIAVSVHNVWRGSVDLSFALELEGVEGELEPGPEDPGPVGPTSLVTAGSEWTYTDSVVEGGDPLNWKQGIVGGAVGFGEFGFGDGDENTELVAGARAYYFTHEFQVDDPTVWSQVELGLAADDGAVVYLNGVEVHRYNMPDGPVDYLTAPITWLGGADELAKTTVVGTEALVAGPNVVAVEVHNIWRGNNDLTFALTLSAS